MTSLPLPPPPEPVQPTTWLEHRSRRAGELTPAWRVVFGIGWLGVVLALAAVWKSGRTLGLSPWWLGPSGDPSNLAIKMLPFVLPVAAVVCAMRNVRMLPWIGIGASLAVAAVAAGDIGRFNGIAAVEMATAGAGLLVSVASFAGMLRPAAAEPDADAPTTDVVAEAAAQ